jgi:hypothetical protein
MKKTCFFGFVVLFVLLATNYTAAQSEAIQVDHFDKIIISPHIEVNLVEGNEESVLIENAKLSEDKINVEVEGKTLRIYLDGAKMVTKSEKVNNGEWKGNKSLYNGTMASATITYKNLDVLSVRGEEVITCKSAIDQDDFKLRIYGESKVYFDSVSVEKLTVSIYGSSYLEVKNGSVDHQVYRAYGESEVNTMEMANASTKITAYGESNFRVKVSDRLKVTCYGETSINYKGDASVDKGIVIGEASIRKIG